MTSDAVRRAHSNLLHCHWEIRKQFLAMDEGSIDSLLGHWRAVKGLRHDVRKHGDGYTFRSVPSDVEQIGDDADLVLIIGRFPLLSADSVFDPHTSLAHIPYWRDGKRLKEYVSTGDSGMRRLLFMVWQRDCPVHGEDLDKAQDAHRFLYRRYPALGELMESQAREAEQFIHVCINWLRAQSPTRDLVVVSDPSNLSSDPTIEGFMASTELHVITRLSGKNATLMDRIVKRLS